MDDNGFKFLPTESRRSSTTQQTTTSRIEKETFMGDMINKQFLVCPTDNSTAQRREKLFLIIPSTISFCGPANLMAMRFALGFRNRTSHDSLSRSSRTEFGRTIEVPRLPLTSLSLVPSILNQNKLKQIWNSLEIMKCLHSL